MPKLFISYRRSDSEDITGRIYDHFEAHYGEESVFMDVEAIPAGVDFREHVTEWIASCDVVMVIVGKDWLDFSRDEGRRSLDNPTDPVRIELTAALKRDVPVIPVLIGDVSMPTAGQLPDELEAFAYRNAVTIRSGRDFHDHVNHLINDIDLLISDTDVKAVNHRPDGIQQRVRSTQPDDLFRLKVITDFFQDNFNILYRVLTEGPAFVDAIDHGARKEVARAVRYAVFLSLLGVVLVFPALKAAGVNFSVPYLIVDTVMSVTCIFLLGLMNHGVAKLLRGKASIQSSIVITVYISSVLIISNILISLAPNIIGNQLVSGPSPPTIQELIVILLNLIVLMYWLYLQTRAFGSIHQFKWPRTLGFGLLSLVTFSLYGIFTAQLTIGYHQPFTDTSPHAPMRSIAVLPFASAGNDQGTEYFAEGLSEEVLVRFSQYEDLTVASRTAWSQIADRGLSLSEIADRLNVAYVLEGSVRPVANNMRITSQLLRANDGLSVWSKSYQGDATDGFKVHEEIAQDIARSARIELRLDVAQRQSANYALFGVNTLALEYFRQSQEEYDLILSGKGGDWLLRERLLKKAVEANPDQYSAQVWLANSYLSLLGGQLSVQEATPVAHAAINRALELGPNSGMTLLQLGQIHLNLDLNYAKAVSIFNQMLENELGYTTWAYFGLARIAQREGRTDEALRFLTSAPGASGYEQANFLGAYAWLLLVSGDYEQVLQVADEALKVGQKGQPRANILNSKATALIMLGRFVEAKPIITESWDLAGNTSTKFYPFLFSRIGEKDMANGILADSAHDVVSAGYGVALDYLALGEVDNAFKAIENGISNHDALLFDSLRTAEFWNEVRDDPRFDDMIRLLDSKETHTDQYLKDHNIKPQTEL